MMSLRRYGSVLFLLLGTVPVEAACNTPRLQSLQHFYKAEDHGQLGIGSSRGHVYILDEYKCFDVSFLRNRNLQIYFNSATDGAAGPPTYLGALILRVFARGSEGFRAYLQRNESEPDSGSSWGHPLPANAARALGESYPNPAWKISDRYYEQNEPLPGVDDIGSFQKLATAPAEVVSARLKNWHALVLAKEGGGFSAQENTASEWARWFKVPPFSGGSILARSYLTKYRAGPRPSWRPFFTSGANQADCVYIVLVAPGDSSRSFKIGGTQSYITLQMHSQANCEAL